MSDVHPQDVHARREQVLARLAALPPCDDRRRKRLELVTRAFLDSPHFETAIGLGWDDDELFGMAPDAPDRRLTEQGLVSGLALSSLSGPKLEAIEAARAVVRCASGARLTSPRRSPGSRPGKAWFEQETQSGGPADV